MIREPPPDAGAYALCARCWEWVPLDALEPPLEARGTVWRRFLAWLNGDTAPRPPLCRRCAR